jgi:mitochondrial chaperone BCS1
MAFFKMRFPSASQAESAAATPSSNMTLNATTSALPKGILDSVLASAGRTSPLMQLLLFVYHVVGAQLGFDPSIVLTVLGLCWGLSKLATQFYMAVNKFIDTHLMSSIAVSENDLIYTHLMKWLSLHPSMQNNQYLMAQTVWKTAWEDEEELEDNLFWTDGGEGDGEPKYLNFSSHSARSVSSLNPCSLAKQCVAPH